MADGHDDAGVGPTFPDFSVVIPMHNRGELACRTIGTVYSQIHPPVETIVVDDGSTDGAGELVQRHFPQVRVIRQDNAGEGPARNTGMTHASSQWIAFVDADDLWLPPHLQELGETIVEHPTARLVATRVARYEVGLPFPSLAGGGRRRTVDYFIEDRRGRRPLTCSSVALHREVFETLGGFSPMPFGIDLEYWVRIAARFPIAISETQTAVYVRAEGRDPLLPTQAPYIYEYQADPRYAGPRERSDLWRPDAEAARQALNDPATIADRESITPFIDHIGAGIVVWCVRSGRREDAQRIARELERPWRGLAPLVRLLAHLPAWLTTGLWSAFAALRRLNPRNP